MSAFRILMVGAALIGLSACGSVGNGNKPKELVVLQIPAGFSVTRDLVLDPPESLKTFEVFDCVGAQLRAFLIFDDNSVGDFTSRVDWSSASPSDLAVSWSGTPVSIQGVEGGFFTTGSLVPRAGHPGGNVTVTAEYLGLRASVSVAIKPVGPMVLEPAFSRVPLDQTTRPAFFRMARGTETEFTVRRKLDGQWSNVPSSVFLTILGDDDNGDPDPANPADTDRYVSLRGGSTITILDDDTDMDRIIGSVSDPADDLDDDLDNTDPDSNGGLAPDLTFVATPIIPGCAAVQAVIKPRKLAPASLTLDYERNFYPEGVTARYLFEGSSQSLRLRGCFASDTDPAAIADDDADGLCTSEGEFQNLGTQVASEFGFDRDGNGVCDAVDIDPPLTEPDPAYPEAPVAFGIRFLRTGNVVTALFGADDEDDNTVPFDPVKAEDDDKTTKLCARFGARAKPDEAQPYPAIAGISSNVIDLATIDGPLTTLSVAASDPCTADARIATLCTLLDPIIADPAAPTLEAGSVVQFKALGTVTDDNGTGLTHAVTNRVIWTSSNTELGLIGTQNTSLGAGQFVALTGVTGTLDVTARFVLGVDDTLATRDASTDPADVVVVTPVTIVPAAD